VSVELARHLVARGAIGRSELQAALREQSRSRVSLAQALISAGILSESALDAELAGAGLPVAGSVVPAKALVDKLPPSMCRALCAVPIRHDPGSMTVDVAAVDPFDTHIAEEFAFHLRCEVRVLRARFSIVDDCLRRIEKSEVDGPGRGLESARPIPLVRRSSGARALEQLGEVDIIEQTGKGDVPTDDRDEPILALRRSKVPSSLASSRPFGRRATDGPAPEAAFDDAGPAIDAMGEATTPDEVMDALIHGMGAVARGVGLLAIRKGSFCGIKCNRKLCNPLEWRQLAVSVGKSTVFSEAMDANSYLGPVPDDPDHAPLLSLIGRTGGEVAVALVRVARRPVLLVLADDLSDALIATRRAEELTHAAGEELARILRETKERPRR